MVCCLQQSDRRWRAAPCLWRLSNAAWWNPGEVSTLILMLGTFFSLHWFDWRYFTTPLIRVWVLISPIPAISSKCKTWIWLVRLLILYTSVCLLAYPLVCLLFCPIACLPAHIVSRPIHSTFCSRKALPQWFESLLCCCQGRSWGWAKAH